MKLLREHRASMSMGPSPDLSSLLGDTVRRLRISHVLETGTYLGLGSTALVAKSFPADRSPDEFVTIEVNWSSWQRAKQNLRKFPFVTPVWGRTVTAREAVRFIENDETLQSHWRYADIFIDDTTDPAGFYRAEVLGRLGGVPRHPLAATRWLADRVSCYAGDNLLEQYLRRFQTKNPLVVLDSAGGIGFLEFAILERVMRRHRYLLLLDDIGHVKHFRSYSQIRHDPRFKVLGVDKEQGWLLAAYTPAH